MYIRGHFEQMLENEEFCNFDNDVSY